MAWTYSDWVTLDAGSAKLSRLRLHIQEISDYLQKNQENSTDGMTTRRFDLVKRVEDLEKKEAQMARDLGVDLPSSPNRATFTTLIPTEP